MKIKTFINCPVYFLVLGLLFFGFSLVTSCTSLILPEPEADDDTLLIIPADTDFSKIGGGSRFNAQYLILEIEDFDKKIEIKPNHRQTFVTGLKPGKHVTASICVKLDSTSGLISMGEPKPAPYYVWFELKPRQITIFPVKFICRVTSYGNEYRTRWDTPPVSEDEKKIILESMKSDVCFPLWENELGIK